MSNPTVGSIRRYRIVVRGRPHFYASRAAAVAVANEIFARTGVIVGIDEIITSEVRS